MTSRFRALNPDNRFRYQPVTLGIDMGRLLWLRPDVPEKFLEKDLCVLWFAQTHAGLRTEYVIFAHEFGLIVVMLNVANVSIAFVLFWARVSTLQVSNVFPKRSTSPPGGNQVDGLPPALRCKNGASGLNGL